MLPYECQLQLWKESKDIEGVDSGQVGKLVGADQNYQGRQMKLLNSSLVLHIIE